MKHLQLISLRGRNKNHAAARRNLENTSPISWGQRRQKYLCIDGQRSDCNLFQVVRPYTHSFHKGNTNLKQAWPKCLQQERRGTMPHSRCNSDKGDCSYSHTNILSQATKTSRLMLSAQNRCSITEACSWSSVQVLSFCHIVLGLGLTNKKLCKAPPLANILLWRKILRETLLPP